MDTQKNNSELEQRLRDAQREITRLNNVLHHLTGTSMEALADKTEELLFANAEKHVMEIALTESEQKYKSIFENALEGIFRVTIDGEVLDVNPRMVELLGYKTTVEFQNHVQKFPDDIFCDCSSWKCLIDELKPGAIKRDFETPIKRNDGTTIWVLLAVRHVINEQGFPMFYEGMIVDITTRKVNEELRITRDAAEAAAKAKSDFLANMSHEIRTPLNAILGYSEILQQKVLDSSIKECLMSINSSGKTLHRLVNDILDLSKIEAKAFELQLQSVDLRFLLNDVKRMFSQKACEKGLGLVCEISTNIPKNLMLDDVRLRQVLINLLGNAIKFTDKGEVRLTANGSSSNGSFNLVLEVSDTGKGIAPDQLQHIFQRFSQQKGQSVADYGGTGLGLAISEKIIQMMGGQISVTSVQNVKTTFSISIDGIKFCPLGDAEIESQIEKTEKIIFKNSKVLIADDIKENRDLLRAFLSDSEIQFVEAENGLEVLELLKTFRPDLILMDYQMPKMNGWEAITKMKEDERLKDIPVIIISASFISEQDRADSVFGCDGFLDKPISVSHLNNELKRFLPYAVAEQDDIRFEENEISLEEYYALTDSNRQRFLQKLEETLWPFWKSVNDSFILEEIVRFAAQLETTAVNFKYKSLEQCANRLRLQAEEFDIEHLPVAMKTIGDLFEIVINSGK